MRLGSVMAVMMDMGRGTGQWGIGVGVVHGMVWYTVRGIRWQYLMCFLERDEMGWVAGDFVCGVKGKGYGD
jgi:hypothetical protein